MRSSPRGQTPECPGSADPAHRRPRLSVPSLPQSEPILPRAFPGGSLPRGGLGSVCKHFQFPILPLRFGVQDPGLGSGFFLPRVPSVCLCLLVSLSLSFLAVSVSSIHLFVHSSKKLSLSTSKGALFSRAQALPGFRFQLGHVLCGFGQIISLLWASSIIWA